MTEIIVPAGAVIRIVRHDVSLNIAISKVPIGTVLQAIDEFYVSSQRTSNVFLCRFRCLYEGQILQVRLFEDEFEIL
jgi:hypothetical protein